jgi:ketosteroid isomerase-like protein
MSPTSIRDALDRTNRIFEQEVAANRNIDALDRVYTADARIVPPEQDIVSGREGIKSYWRSLFEQAGIRSIRLETVDVQIAGDVAIEIGRGKLEVTKPAPATLDGKYVVVWKQEAGEWKWHIDIWNTRS